MTATKIQITWDGTTRGLDEHKLSLAAFREPLSLLLSCFRRIATSVVTNAEAAPDYGARGGPDFVPGVS